LFFRADLVYLDDFACVCSERDSSGGALARRTKRTSAPLVRVSARRYERSEPRIARRKPQKKSAALFKSAAVFFVREAARPKEFCFAKFNEKLKMKN
jgi:hypothetical protein